MSIMNTVTNKYINFNSYSFSDDEKQELIDTINSGWITTGPKTQKFEEQFAEYLKVKYAVGVSSGTAALHLSLLALGIGASDEVITTPMTFVATINAILYVGARPVLADIDRNTLNISPDEIKNKLTKKTRAIIPVHYAGQPCEMDSIIKIAQEHNLFIIGDAAHAIETEYKNKKVGAMGNTACFSFHPIKNITTGEGGMVTTNNKNIADKIKVLRLHGLDKNAWKRYSGAEVNSVDMEALGYKYNMTDIQASLGIHQLKKIDKFRERRKTYSDLYDSILAKNENIILLPKQDNFSKNAFHLYPVRIKTENLTLTRDEILKKMQASNIGVSVHFHCAHLFSFYKEKFGYGAGMFPAAEYAAERLISLPLYPKMEEEDIIYVAETLNEIVNNGCI